MAKANPLHATSIAEALDEARRRIRKDGRGVAPELAFLLEAIAEGLDDLDFDARKLDGATPEVLGRFRLGLGLAANAYHDQRRLEIAHHLVRASQVPLAEISHGLGFRTPELFRKWFRWRVGLTPANLRRKSAPSPLPGDEGGQQQTDRSRSRGNWPTRWDWDRLVLGAVSAEEVQWLLRLLLAKYPELDE